MPGENTIIQVFPKAEEQVATDIFKVSITGGIELSYIISQNCPHIAPPYPEGATIKDVKVQGQLLRQWLMTAQQRRFRCGSDKKEVG